MVKQAEITMNLLSNSRTEPKLLLYAPNVGTFDIYATPMPPLGTKVITHKKSNQRASWIKHGVAGWYIGPVLEKYRCYRIFG